MKKFIINIEVPTLLGVIALHSFEGGHTVTGVVLIVVAAFRLFVNVVTND